MQPGTTDRDVLTGEQPAPHATLANAAARTDLAERYAAMATGITWTHGVVPLADWSLLMLLTRPRPFPIFT
jgi:hypothetical protein